MKRTTKMFAMQDPDGFMHNFFGNPYTTALCGTGKVLEVDVTEGEDTPDSWWAWWELKPPQGSQPGFCFVYQKSDLVRMCFPYDLRLYEERGDGLLLPVTVTVVREVPDDDPLYTKPNDTKPGRRPQSM